MFTLYGEKAEKALVHFSPSSRVVDPTAVILSAWICLN